MVDWLRVGGNAREHAPGGIRINELLGNRKVVHADDQRNVRKMQRTFISRLGVDPERIIEAEDGKRALSIIHEFKADIGIILLDWNLSQVPGIKVVQSLRNDPLTKFLPVLMVSGETEESQILQASEEGVNGYMIKPFSEKDLGEKIRNILNPPPYMKLMNMAESMIDNADYDNAIVTLQSVLKRKPSSAGAKRLLGLSYQGKGDKVKAAEHFAEAVTLNPRYLKALSSLAEFQIGNMNYIEALKTLEWADNISPNMASRKVLIGEVHIELKQEKKAEMAFESAIRIDPEISEEVANVLLAKGEARLATKFINEAVSLRRKQGSLGLDEVIEFIARYNRAGIEFRKKGLLSQSIETYKSALNIDPKNAAVHFNIARAYKDNGAIKEAREYFIRSKDLNDSLASPDIELASRVADELSALA